MTSSDPRIAALEGRIRWLTAVCVFLGLGLVSLFVRPYFEPPPGATGKARPDRPDLSLRSLSIPDSTGTVRVQAGLYTDGTPFIKLNGSDGKERVAAAVGAGDQPEIRLADRMGRSSARIELDEAGRALLRMSDENGSPVVALMGRGDGGPALVVWDSQTRETLFSAPDRRRRQAAASR